MKINAFIKILFFCFSFLFLASNSQIYIKPEVSKKSRQFFQKKKFQGTQREKNFYNLKKYHLAKKYKSCLTLSKKMKTESFFYRKWITVYRLKCAYLSKNKGHMRAVLGEIDIEKLKNTVSQTMIVPLYIDVALEVIEGNLSKRRKRALKQVEKLLSLENYMSKEMKTKFYLLIGELFFIEQKNELAFSYFYKATGLEKKELVLGEIKKYESILKNYIPKGLNLSEGLSKEKIFYSQDEAKRYNNFENYKVTKNYVAAVEEGGEFLEEFPASSHSSYIFNQILIFYFKTPKALQSRLLSIISKSPPHWRLKWAHKIYLRGYYGVTVELIDGLDKNFSSPEKQEKSIWIQARSHYFLGQYKQALRQYEKLIKMSSKKHIFESLFKKGLLKYRFKDFEESLSSFERLRILSKKENKIHIHDKSLYWIWKSLDKFENKKEASQKKKLVENELLATYPLSYYSLLLRKHRDKKIVKKELLSYVSLKKTAQKIPLWLLGKRKNFQKIKFLYQVGWFEEAQKEMDLWPKASTSNEKLAYGVLRAEAFDYAQATRNFFNVFYESPSLIRLDLLSLIYPKEFKKTIEQNSLRYKLPSSWLYSLIRQESQFNSKALSSSKAVGLTQVIKSTAEEIAQDLKVKAFRFPESLENPKISVKFGAYYLKKLLKSHHNYLPLALGAYNAGTGRLNRWISSRSELKNSFEKRNISEEEMELLIEEIPWIETNGYIKSVLKNIIIYKIIYENQIILEKPLWTEV